MLEKRIIEVAPLAFMRGRAQSLDSLLMTLHGWQKMGESLLIRGLINYSKERRALEDINTT